MASRRWWCLVVAVVCLVAMAGRQEKRLEEILIDAPDRTGPEFAANISIDPTRETISCNGEVFPMTVTWGSYAKTQIDEGFEASGVVRIFGVEDMPTGSYEESGFPIRYVALGLGDASIDLYVTDAYESGGIVHYRCYVEFWFRESFRTFYGSIPGDGDWQDFEWAITREAAVYTESSTSPIGTKSGTTHAKENTVADGWFTTGDITVKFGEWEHTFSAGDPPPALATALGVHATLAFSSHYGAAGTTGLADELLQITANFNAADPDFSLLDVDIEPQIKYSSYQPGHDPHLSGDGNTLTWSLPNGWPGTCKANWGGVASAPRFYSFGGLSAIRLDCGEAHRRLDARADDRRREAGPQRNRGARVVAASRRE